MASNGGTYSNRTTKHEGYNDKGTEHVYTRHVAQIAYTCESGRSRLG